MFGYSFAEWSIANVAIRMVVALILGCIVGLDRSVKRRGAGTKTHTVVCMGAALVALTAQYMEEMFPGHSDMARMSAQVISGVGFLGVGTIFVSDHKIRGLTTAASLWTCACIGLAAGIGFIEGAVFVTALLLIALHLLPAIERRILANSKYYTLYIEMENNKAVPGLIEQMKKEGFMIDTFDVVKTKGKDRSVSVLTTIKIDKKEQRKNYMEILQSIEGVVAVENL